MAVIGSGHFFEDFPEQNAMLSILHSEMFGETRALRGHELDSALPWIAISDFSSEMKHKLDQLKSARIH